MSFVKEALKSKPVALFPLDGGSFTDVSGYGQTGVAVGGTVAFACSVAKGIDKSTVFSSTINGKFSSPVFRSGRESDSFTLEANVRLISTVTNQEQQILGNLDQMDGLTINGTVVSMVTKYTGGSEARASFDIQQNRRVTVHGVHTNSKNMLFVNGVMVSEVNITEEQQALTFVSTDNFLYSGKSAAASFISVNGIGVYCSALSPSVINNHYLAASQLPEVESVVDSFGGGGIPVSLSNGNIFLDQYWSSELDWKSATLMNVAVSNSQLRPQFENGVSVPGLWMDSFAIDSAEGTSIFGVSANWDGKGFILEVSLDGITWETVSRGKNIALITPGFNPTDKEIQIRISFAGGVSDDDAFVDNLNFIGIKSGVAPAILGRTVTFTNAYQEREYPVIDLHDNWGVEVGPAGNIVISADSIDSVPARTVEVWLKKLTSAAITHNLSVSQTYINGVLNPAVEPKPGEWFLLHYVLTADNLGTISLGSDLQIGHVGIYPTALSGTDITKIYSSYIGNNILSVNDAGTWSVTQTSPASRIYGYDWSITAAG